MRGVSTRTLRRRPIQRPSGRRTIPLRTATRTTRMDTRRTDTLRTAILRTAIRRLHISTGRSRTEVFRPIGSRHPEESVQHRPAMERPALLEQWRVAAIRACDRAMTVARCRRRRAPRRPAAEARRRARHDPGRGRREGPFRGVDTRAAEVRAQAIQVAAAAARRLEAAVAVRAAALPPMAVVDALRSRDSREEDATRIRFA